MKRIYAYAFLAALLLSPVLCHGLEAAKPDYYEMTRQLKNGVYNIDYTELRMSYTRTPDYKPYGGDSQDILNAAYEDINSGNYLEAAKKAESLLQKNFVDLDAHALCRYAYKKLGDNSKHEFHTYVLKGLLDSLLSSGDGSSPEKAIVVISVSEEYSFLRAHGLSKIRQKLLNIKGHRYDLLETENKKTGQKKNIYFNIDIPYNWLAKNMKK